MGNTASRRTRRRIFRSEVALACIYVLIDPRCGTPRYVGYTGGDPYKRLLGHIKEARANASTHKCKWLVGLLHDGVRPTVIVLEYLGDRPWQPRERRWITYLGLRFPLTNGTVGGDGRVGHTVGQETRAKISATLRGRSLNDEHRANVSAALRGKPKSPEHVAKLRGLKRTAATKRRMSEAQRGRKGPSVEMRVQIAAKLRARPFDEARAAQLAAARGTFDAKRSAQLAEARRKHSENCRRAREGGHGDGV